MLDFTYMTEAHVNLFGKFLLGQCLSGSFRFYIANQFGDSAMGSRLLQEYTAISRDLELYEKTNTKLLDESTKDY